MNAICGDCFANVAIRSCFVDTVVEFRCIRRVSQKRFHDSTSRFPPLAPTGCCSPASSVLSRRYDFLTLIPPHSVAVVWRYLGFTRYVRSSTDECAAEAWSWLPGISGRDAAEETTGSPKFLGNLEYPFAHVQSTPAGLRAPDHYDAAAWPLVFQKQRLPRKVFRSSIAWLSDSLSTHRRVRYLPRRKTRFRPLVRRYRTGFPPARFLRKVSKLHPYISSPFPKLCLAQ